MMDFPKAHTLKNLLKQAIVSAAEKATANKILFSIATKTLGYLPRTLRTRIMNVLESQGT
jgi:hypothetical protein